MKRNRGQNRQDISIIDFRCPFDIILIYCLGRILWSIGTSRKQKAKYCYFLNAVYQTIGAMFLQMIKISQALRRFYLFLKLYHAFEQLIFQIEKNFLFLIPSLSQILR